jgi:hypothetical protein
MNTTHWLIFFCAYFILFALGVGLIAIRIRKKRKDRPPVEFKLLRGPGETLRKRMAKYDEDLLFRIGGAATLPLLAIYPVLTAIVYLKLQTGPQVYAGIALAVVVFLAVLFFSGRSAVFSGTAMIV